MNTITLEDGTLCLEGDILNGAREALKETRYVEAFALLHALIDWWMTALIRLDWETKKERTEKLPNQYRFMGSLKRLRRKEIIDDNERERLLKFYDMRNLIIYRLVTRSYLNEPEPNRDEPETNRNKSKKNRNEPETDNVTEKEVFEEFKEGEELVQALRGKTGLVLSGRFKHLSYRG